MATEFDREIVDWLRGNIVALDSLTGDDVAFAMFSGKFGAPGSPAENRRAKVPIENIGDESASYYTVHDLVTSGKLGWLTSEDELTLLTYGTDEMAKAFGVVGDLPCLLVIDALPQEHVDVVPLRGVDLDELFRLIRSSIGELIQAPGLATFRTTARKLASTERQIRAIVADLSNPAGPYNTARTAAALTNEAYERARSALASGAIKQFANCLRGLSGIGSIGAACSLANAKREELQWTDRTSRTLGYYLRECSWPLEATHRRDLVRALNRQVKRHRQGSPDLDDRAACAALAAELEAQNTAIVHSVLELLPSRDVLVGHAVAEEDGRVEAARRRLEKAQRTLGDLVTHRERLVRALAAADYPSLSAILGKAARRQRITVARRKVGSFAAAFASGALSPSTLIEVAKAAAGR